MKEPGILTTTILVLAMMTAISCGDKKKERGSAPIEPAGQTAEAKAVASPSGDEETTLKATLEFEETEFDFGTIDEGEVVTHTYSFTNAGEAPLIIQSATASCGCTVPSWPKEPIPTGESGKIEVRFNSSGKPNMQNKTVTIIANTEPKTTYLKLKGMVTPKSEQPAGPVRKN